MIEVEKDEDIDTGDDVPTTEDIEGELGDKELTDVP